MKKAIGIILAAVTLTTIGPAALAAEPGTDKADITYKAQIGPDDFKLYGITAERYGNAYVFTLRYQSGKDRLCAVLEPNAAGNVFDMVQLPAAKDSGTCTLDRTVDEINAAKSLTLTISADRQEAANPVTVTMTNLPEQLKNLQPKKLDSITMPLLRSFASKDVSLADPVVRLDGDSFKFSLSYDFGSPKRLSFFDPPMGNSVSVFDGTKTLTGAGVWEFSVPVKNFRGVKTISIKIMGTDPNQADYAQVLNVRSLARLSDVYTPAVPYDEMTRIGTALEDGHGGYLLPLRTVFEARGHEVTWDGKTNTVHIAYHFSGRTIPFVFTVGSAEMTMDGSAQPLGGPVVLIDGKTYAPAGNLTSFLAVIINPSTLAIYIKAPSDTQ